jgi:hypothetical protein
VLRVAALLFLALWLSRSNYIARYSCPLVFFSGITPCNIEVLLMNNITDSLPYSVKVSFFEHQRREWEKVVESSKTSLSTADNPDWLQHWENVNNYALSKIQEIDRKIEELKLGIAAQLSAVNP